MREIPSPYEAIVESCRRFDIDPLEVLYSDLPMLDASALEPDDDPLKFDTEFEEPMVPVYLDFFDVKNAQFGPVERAA